VASVGALVDVFAVLAAISFVAEAFERARYVVAEYTGDGFIVGV
jgi:hypothetical protein